LIELDKRKLSFSLRLDEVQFREIIVSLVTPGDNLRTILVEHLGTVDSSACCLREQFLLLAELTIF